MRILVVDAFTDTPWSGNPAGVCLVDREVDAAWMQALAAEMRHSATAFVEPSSSPDADFGLRWFSPGAEVALCGHATLATAHVLFERDGPRPIRFATRSGVLTVRPEENGLVSMDFPALPPEPAPPPAGLVAALGAEPTWVGRSRFDVLAEVADEDTVRTLRPDLTALAAVEARGIIVTAAADASSPYDFVSRFFAPTVGVPEDPATGSAHCVLAVHWAPRLRRGDGAMMTGAQLSARGGVVRVRLRGDRVDLAGRAVTVLDGVLAV